MNDKAALEAKNARKSAMKKAEEEKFAAEEATRIKAEKETLLKAEQSVEETRMSELERLEMEFGLNNLGGENDSDSFVSETIDQPTESQQVESNPQIESDSGTLEEIGQTYDLIEKEQSEVAARLLELELERTEEKNFEETEVEEGMGSDDLQFLEEVTRTEEQQERQVEEVATSPEQNLLDIEARKLADMITKSDELYTPSDKVLASTPLLMKEVAGTSLENYSAKEGFFKERDVGVHAGNTLSVPVRVSTPGTIVEFSIEKKSYDFGFGITAFLDEGQVAKIKVREHNMTFLSISNSNNKIETKKSTRSKGMN